LPTSRSRRGLKAEVIAAAELGRRGYRIVGSNYRCRYGEIDLVAFEGDTLVFVEVRSRRSISFGDPSESVTAAKQQKLLLTAEHYLSTNDLSSQPCRFDVVTVVFSDGRMPQVEVIRGAFGEPDA